MLKGWQQDPDTERGDSHQLFGEVLASLELILDFDHFDKTLQRTPSALAQLPQD